MKSATAFALVASIAPLALASPYHMQQHAERDVEVDWVTDIAVVTAYAEVTEYWTGPPAVQTTVTTTTAAAAVSSAVHDKQGQGHHWTWSSEQYVAPTTTSTPPPPAPTTTSTSSIETPTSSSTPEVVYTTWWPSVAPTTTQAPTTTAVPTTATTPTTTAAPAPTAYAETGTGPYSIDCGSKTISADVGAKTGSAGYDLDDGAMQAALLNSTNTWRAMFQAAPVAWNYSLQTMAQNTANGCQFEHTNAGQNLAAGYSGPESANDGWAGEYTSFNFADPDWSEAAGHFTQVVWQDTTTMGCAAVNCGSNQPAVGWYLVCNYFPVGNMLGEFPENVKSKTS